MNNRIVTLLATLLAAMTCGATFLFALFRQFAMVEVAASLATGAQLYLLSSTIGDFIENKKEPSKLKLVTSLALAAGVVLYFLLMKYINS